VIVDKKVRRNLKSELRKLIAGAEKKTSYAKKFEVHEIDTAIKSIKLGKAAGLDEIYPEFIKIPGPKTRQWLAKFYTYILEIGKLPKQFKITKILVILKSGKPNKDVKSYRPISLLSTSSKLLERLIYNRISDTINTNIPIEQAGFRPNRSCCDQVLSITTRIEKGYEDQIKTSVAFIDLTAAYDTVWRESLITKFLKIIPCLTM